MVPTIRRAKPRTDLTVLPGEARLVTMSRNCALALVVQGIAGKVMICVRALVLTNDTRTELLFHR